MEQRTNRQRARVAELTLIAGYGSTDVRLEPDCPVIDALTDLRHFCDARGLEFGNLDRIAHGHYLAELEETRNGDEARQA